MGKVTNITNRKRLNNSRSIRQQLANLYHDLSEDKITESKARTLAYISSIMLRAVESSELEEKLELLEEKFQNMKG